jgi:malonyl-CoA/methylmalonyl-CoA synthetase
LVFPGGLDFEIAAHYRTFQPMPPRPAIVAADGTFTYEDLEHASARVASALLDGAPDLAEERVAFFVTPGFAHVAVRQGIWRAGGVAVPLAISHPPAELEHVIRDSAAEYVVAEPAASDMLGPLAQAVGARLFTTTELLEGVRRDTPLPNVAATWRAMIVYTSGTTGRPKGVVTTHAVIGAQVASLVEAWKWNPVDRLLHVLPLHHVHGIINGLGCVLAVRATCEMLPAFDAEIVWDRLSSGDITVFTAVPTVYRKLIASWEAAPAAEQRRRSQGVRRLRLMMSGSAALPVQTLERWREISGHTLLERYGMTEIGMALANPVHGERRPGYVGVPLPDVDVQIVDEEGIAVLDGNAGELEVTGPTVFKEYWQRPEETRKAFRRGWFRTGDVAVVENGYYRLLGRTSVDIIKTGGFKVSALEIEEVLRTHPAIAECAVVGVEDPDWGERVSAAIELRPSAALSLEELQQWAKERLAPYKVPRAVCTVKTLPRNAMGKVVKPDVTTLFKS